MSSHPHDERETPGQNEARAQKDAALMRILEPAARMRLSNIRMVKPDLARTVEDYLIGLASQNRLQYPVGDQQLKQILLSKKKTKRDFRINRR